MKKNSLFKIILIMLLLVVILSYFVPNRNAEIAYTGLGDVFINGVQSFYYFFDTALFVIVLGGFYGVLNKTAAYKKLLDTIVTKVKPNSKKFVFVTLVVFALITSLTGITMPLLVFVPLVLSIILLLGYDKLVALSSTIGGIIIGFIGGIFVTFKDPNSYYSVVYTTFEEFTGAEKLANLFPKIFLLFAGCALLIYYINKHIKNVEEKKVKYNLSKPDLKISEVKEDYKNIKTLPLIIVLALVLILLILGLVPWSSLFGLDIFNDFHTWLTGLSISGFALFPNIISANFTAFGEWATLGNYLMVIIVLLLAIIVIKFIGKIKFDEMIEGFVEGAKKILPVALMMILAYTVLICCYNNGFMENLIAKASDSMGSLNLAMASLFTVIGSITNVDLYYTTIGIFTPIVNVITDESMFQVLALAFQTLNGLVMLIGPTSLILIFGLTYLDVSYPTWLKYIWRFILELFILIFVVLIIVSLI